MSNPTESKGNASINRSADESEEWNENGGDKGAYSGDQYHQQYSNRDLDRELDEAWYYTQQAKQHNQTHEQKGYTEHSNRNPSPPPPPPPPYPTGTQTRRQPVHTVTYSDVQSQQRQVQHMQPTQQWQYVQQPFHQVQNVQQVQPVQQMNQVQTGQQSVAMNPMCFMPVPYYGYNPMYQYPFQSQYAQQSVLGGYGTQVPQTGTAPISPQALPTPSPSPPPVRPDKRSDKRHRDQEDIEEYSVSEDEGDETEGYEKDSDDDENKEESAKYKDKVRWALKLCHLEPPMMKQNPTSLMISQKEKIKNVFPVDNTINEHFKRSWENLTGNEHFSDRFSTEGPNKPVKSDLGFKSALTNRHFKSWYGMAGEVKDTKSELRWPLYDWKIDEDFNNVFRDKNPEKRSTTSKSMVEVGKMIAVLNQSAVFTKASNSIIEDFGRFVNDEGKERWAVLKEFMEVRSKSMDDLIGLSTNLQLNLLIARREETLKATGTGLSKHESNILKFAPPVDQHGRLFTGKLEEFKEWRGKREQTNVVTDLLKSSGRKRSNPEKKFEGDSNKKRRFSDDRNQSFRGKGNRYKGRRENKEPKFFSAKRQSGDSNKARAEKHN